MYGEGELSKNIHCRKIHLDAFIWAGFRLPESSLARPHRWILKLAVFRARVIRAPFSV